MKYASEILGLMPAYPNRRWKMVELVREVLRGRPATKQDRDRARQGILRVLKMLQGAGQVEVERHADNVMRYAWRKVRHEVPTKVPKVRQVVRQ